MAQVKIYGLSAHIDACRAALGEAVHASLVSAFGLPEAKRFQRFIRLQPGDFVYPADRSERYTIIEIHAFSGRSDATKAALIRAMIANVHAAGVPINDIEITIIDTPIQNWGIRGVVATELQLSYSVGDA